MGVERMDRFFADRVLEYDAQMLENVEGCAQAYQLMAELLPARTERLLDLGCGTGLELEAIFQRFPELAVKGMDLTQEMLDLLAAKYPRRRIELECEDYFAADFGKQLFSAVISFQTMHHFTHERKAWLYRKICNAIEPGGCYIECDYMLTEQAEEERMFAGAARLREEWKIGAEELVHLDTPCTIENQVRLLQQGGFRGITQEYRRGNTTILVAWVPAEE